MNFEVQNFDHTINEALVIAKKYYEENGNKKEIHKEFKHCKLSKIIDYIDEYNVKYSDVNVIAYTKPVDWEDYEESCFDVSFSVKMTEEELKIAIRKFAETLYEDSIESYKRKVYDQVQNQFNHIVGKKYDGEMK